MKKSRRDTFVIAGVMLGVAIIGTALFISSHAATPYIASEPESGTLSGGAVKITDATASGGAAIKFATPTPAPTPSPTPSPTGFVHPGVFVGKAQLDFVKNKIATGQQPWANALAVMKGKVPARLTFVPQPTTTIFCDKSATPDPSCANAQNASVSAYTDALLWYYTGDQAYANEAIEIMNAYANTTTSYAFDSTVNTNGLLEAAWAGENYTRAAEIIRYSNAGWSATDIAKFEGYLKNVILPRVINGWTGGGANWLSSMYDATMGIGVFTNDRAVFDDAVKDWRLQVPSMFYMDTDTNPTFPNLVGKLVPIPPANTNFAKTTTTYSIMQTYWFSAARFETGMQGETCRDLTHATFGFEGMANAAETARIQGIDLWSEQKTRIIKSMEYNANVLNMQLAATPTTPAGWPCVNPPKLGGNGYALGWEVAYNHYATRGGTALPQTQALISKIRPTGYALHMNWETLTSAGTP